MQASRPRGVIAATPTPVRSDFTPDLPRLIHHCRALLEGGCDAINLLGTTGEATSFSTEQRIDVMRAIAKAGLPLPRFMVGTGVCALADTVTLTRAAADLGFAGALVLPPFFYPDPSAAGLTAYVDALIERVAHPRLTLYLYHIPQNTGVPWPVELVAALRARHPATLVGLKDSAGDLAYARELAKAVPDFDVFPSSEGSLGQATADGFAGCISATTNLTAMESQTAWSSQGTAAGAAAVAKAGELRTFIAGYPLVASVKSALAAVYDDPQWTRLVPPLIALTAEQSTSLVRDLDARRNRP
jgi:4-hydroxy-tetrahydrodipicolinate synthase